MRRKAPALGGTVWDSALKMPTIADVRAQASLMLRPKGRESALSRRSTSIRASAGSTRTETATVTPSGAPGMGSWVLATVRLPPGSPLSASTMRRSL